MRFFGRSFFVFMVIVLFGVTSQPALLLAQGTTPPPPTPQGLLTGINCIQAGNCTPENILQVLVNVMQMILGIIGSLMLGMFVWGGFQILASAGKSDMIENGKTTLVNAVIGMMIVFGAWLAINTITTSLLKEDFTKQDDIRLNTQQLINTQVQ